jgi:hypothetical protein
MIHFMLIILLFILMFDNKINTREEVDNSKNFYMSGGMSKEIYNKINDSKMKRTFLYLEDSLLEIEKLAIQNGIVMTKEATLLSNKIKELFPQYNFSYHGIHLKQIAEPTKIVNIYLSS